jgi:maleylpyruvate isomerase
VTPDQARNFQKIDDATERLLKAAARLGDADMRAPSRLPGWTRGHVLTHIARGGNALTNLLTWARTGVETPAYRSQEARDADIEAGAGRPAAELLADVAESAAAFRAAVSGMPDDAWSFPVRGPVGPDFPAAQLLARRLTEIELHHTDLDIGYGPADWPSEFATMELDEPMRSLREDRAKGR